MKTAIIDADSIIYIVAYHNAVDKNITDLFQGTEEEIDFLILELYKTKDTQAVLDHIDGFVNDILNAVNATHYLGFLGNRNGSNTFRHKLAITKPYKGQRSKSPHWIKYWKPIITEHLVSKWKFEEVSDIEADDACAIYTTHLSNSVLCSPDKDILQIPGEHYNYKKIEHTFISNEEALKRLFTQVIIGDTVDNIPGCPGVGEKSPFLQFKGCNTFEEYVNYTKNVFKSKGHESMYDEQFSLVYMLRDISHLSTITEPIERPIIGEVTPEFTQSVIVNLPPSPPSFSQ